MGNIQKACKAAGIARSSFYEIKRAYEKFGREGLASRCKGKKVQEIHREEEKKVLDFTRKYPGYSYKRLTDQLHLAGFGIGESLVRRVWKKHGLEKTSEPFFMVGQRSFTRQRDFNRREYESFKEVKSKQRGIRSSY